MDSNWKEGKTLKRCGISDSEAWGKRLAFVGW